jgi:hypothetical protein
MRPSARWQRRPLGGFKVFIGDYASPEDPHLEKYKDSLDINYHRFESNLGGIS